MKNIHGAAGAVLFLVAVQGAAFAQEARPSNGLVAPPPPVVTRPGGDGNVSQYEYAPEKQPTWQYSAPGSTEDACSAAAKVWVSSPSLSPVRCAQSSSADRLESELS